MQQKLVDEICYMLLSKNDIGALRIREYGLHSNVLRG